MAKKVIHEDYSYNRDMALVTIPIFIMAFFFYGPRVWLLALLAVATAKVADRLVTFVRSRRYDSTENSSIPIALIIVLLMPATVRFRVVIAAVLMAVLVAKEAFGGAGAYPFNPAAVGFCVVAVSWPSEVFSYPQPNIWLMSLPDTAQQLLATWSFEGVSLVNGSAYVLKGGGVPNISVLNIVLGYFAGPIGATSVLVLLTCVIYLRTRKHFNMVAPLSFLVTVCLIAFLLPRGGEVIWTNFTLATMLARLKIVGYELTTGALLFSCVFMVNENCTVPRLRASRIIYGALLGFATMMFRYYGAYELGVCFAALLVNSISGYFDRAVSRFKSTRKKVVAK